MKVVRGYVKIYLYAFHVTLSMHNLAVCCRARERN
uniref:Uncharacterized protein n=1 Tax=Anguilla anguilla TaxID=7936 RepID=A0A0E9U1X1_ANGAN